MKNTTKNAQYKTAFFSETSRLPSSLSDQYKIIDTPTDGSCLFWAIVLAYLVEIRADNQFLDNESYQLKFSLACKVIFGEIEQESIKLLIKLIDRLYSKGDTSYSFNPTMIKLVTLVFRKRVVDFMARHEDEFKSFVTTKFNTYLESMRMTHKYGGEPEVRAVVKLLGCNITVFDPERQSPVFHKVDTHSSHTSEIRTSPPLIQLRTLYLFYKASEKHYFFGIKNNVLSDNENSEKLPSPQMNQPFYPTKSKDVIELNFKAEKSIYLPSLLDGIAIGIFLEALLWLLPGLPLTRGFPKRKPMDRFDNLLMSFLDEKKPLTMGIIGGTIGSLMGIIYSAAMGSFAKISFKSENRTHIFLMLLIAFSIMPVETIFNKKIEKVQMLVLGFLMLFLAPRGFLNIINISLPYISKTTNAAMLLTDKITEQLSLPSLFFRQETKKVQQKESKEYKEIILSGPTKT